MSTGVRINTLLDAQKQVTHLELNWNTDTDFSLILVTSIPLLLGTYSFCAKSRILTHINEVQGLLFVPRQTILD